MIINFFVDCLVISISYTLFYIRFFSVPLLLFGYRGTKNFPIGPLRLHPLRT